MHWLPGPTGEPGNAPASYTRRAFAAIIFPLLVTPIFTVMSVPDVGPVPINTSVRSISNFTGRPVLCDKIAATGSR